MNLVIAALSGVGATMFFFIAMFHFINTRSDKDGGKIYKCWDIANDLHRQKVEALRQIADHLETANNIAQHK